MKILICGFGNVGKHIYYEFEKINKNKFSKNQILQIFIYDINEGFDFDNRVLHLNDNYDFAFICVPTEMKEDGSCNISIVDDCVSKINSNIIIIKSTIPTGTTEYLKNKYKKNIIFSPEYYGTTIHSPKSPDFLILGGNKTDCDKAAELYHKIKPSSFKIIFTDFKTAELVKYMENSFLALKVTFCSEFYNIAKALGISYNELRELFVLDDRMGKSHTYIDSEFPYYNSHCLNKDIPALISFCEKYNIDVPLLKKMNEVNQNMKKYNI